MIKILANLGRRQTRAMIIATILALPNAAVIVAQTEKGNMATSTLRRTARLTSTLEVVQQKYCSDGRMYMKLKATYRNIGDLPILLYKGGNFGYRWEISQVKGRMKAGFTQVVQPMFELNTLIRWNEVPQESEFPVLAPNASVSQTWKGGIAIRTRGGQRGNRTACGAVHDTRNRYDLVLPYALG